MNINATLIGQSIIFIIFVWFCYKFIWPPIVAAMAERRQKIEQGLLAAEKGMAAEQEAKEKVAESINQSKNQAAEIIANAHKQASQTVEDAKSSAMVEADKIIAKAMTDIEQERNSAANELKDKLAGLVMDGVNRVLAKEVDEKTHKDMLSKLSTTL